MKDSVQNRQRIGFPRKLRIAKLALQENGPLWCLAFLTYYVASSLGDKAFRLMDGMRRKRGIPGLNSLRLNKEIWDSWNWSAEGEEWTISPEWNDSLKRCVLEPEIQPGSRILEIGPGGGRWTEQLLTRASEYIGVDISMTCVEHCRRKFGHYPSARFLVGSGCDLGMLEDNSVDAVWSFDVFVHINATDVDRYAGEFRRVLRSGGVGVIHHGGVGGATGGWRSDVTREIFEQILRRHGLRIKTSLDQWRDGEVVRSMTYGDRMTVFRKA